MILNNFKKKMKKNLWNFFGSKLPETVDKHKKHMLPFSLDVKMIPEFFSASKAFLKEYSVILILIPEV